MFSGPPSQVPAEVDLQHLLRKYLSGTVQVRQQAPAVSSWGTFAIDFLIEYEGRRIAVECDGCTPRESRYATDTWGDVERRTLAARTGPYDREWLEEWRDAIVLGTEAATDVVRFSVQDVEDQPQDCIYFLSRFFPAAFTARAKEVVARLATPDAQSWDRLTGERIHLRRLERDEAGEVSAEHSFIVWWRRRGKKRAAIWEGLYESALTIGPCSFDDLVSREGETRSKRNGG